MGRPRAPRIHIPPTPRARAESMLLAVAVPAFVGALVALFAGADWASYGLAAVFAVSAGFLSLTVVLPGPGMFE